MTRQTGETHIIEQQTIEINFEAISDALGLQHRITELYYEKLLPQMELLFDEFADERHFISFETLTIDCGVISHKHWEGEWVVETIRRLRSALLAAHSIKRKKATEARLSEDLLFFLQTGRLPWNSRIASMNELEQIMPDGILIRKLKAIVQENPKAADRLVYSFPEEFVKHIIGLLAEEKAAIDFIPENRDNRVHQKVVHASLIKKLCVEQQEEKESFEDEADVLIRKDKKGINKAAVEPEYVYVHNAGMVLLHPFLKELFQTLGLVTEEHWSNELSAHTAAIVLEYLVWGTDDCPEFDLPLNKILCGFDLDEVLITEEPLSAETKKEGDDLLRVVIQYWKALKNTGIEALRETFLQRNGKLTKAEKGWLLQVEQKPADVLFARLPWGFGVITSPLMKDMLYVEWI